MDRLRVCLVVAVALVPASFASAGPVTITFDGQWQFYDTPEFAPDFHTAMTAAGIANGTPLSLSVTVADAAASASGSAGAVLGGALTIGSLSYAIGSSSLSLGQSCAAGSCSGSAHLFTHLFGSTLNGDTTTFHPNFIQFDSGLDFSASGTLSSSLAGAAWRRPFIFVSFWNQPVIPPQFGSSGNMGISDLVFRSVSVPEPGPLALVAGALAVLHLRRRALRRQGPAKTPSVSA